MLIFKTFVWKNEKRNILPALIRRSENILSFLMKPDWKVECMYSIAITCSFAGEDLSNRMRDGGLIYVRLKFRRNGVRARFHLSHTRMVYTCASPFRVSPTTYRT